MADMPEIITRREAKENGLKFYFTGKPCVHSHVFIRHTQNGVCVQCVKDNYQKNKEAIKERSRKHHHNMMQNQPDKVLIKRQRNMLYQRERRARDFDYVEKMRAFSRENNRKNRNRELHRLQSKNRKAKIKGAEGRFTREDVQKMLINQNWLCNGCGANFKTTCYHVDHIMPLALGGTNWPDNLQCLCPACNMQKSAKHPEVWLKQIGRI